MTDSFPRQYARTRGFNLGLPRSFSIASDGSRVAFLRTARGDDPLGSLWVLDVADGRERLAYGPEPEAHITDEERDRRERMRERQTGVVTYAADPDLRLAAFVSGERLLAADLVEGGVRELTPGRAGLRSPAGSDRTTRGLRHGRSAACDRPRGRHRPAARARRGSRCALGDRGVRGGRGDGATTWVLVGARRDAAARSAGRRPAARGLAHRLADRPGGATAIGAVPTDRQGELDRDAPRARPGRLTRRRRVGPRGVRIRRGGLVDRGRPTRSSSCSPAISAT